MNIDNLELQEASEADLLKIDTIQDLDNLELLEANEDSASITLDTLTSEALNNGYIQLAY